MRAQVSFQPFSQSRNPASFAGITTAAGSIPLLPSSRPGTKTRMVIGTVVLSGILAATVFTLFVVPVAYDLLARRSGRDPQGIAEGP